MAIRVTSQLLVEQALRYSQQRQAAAAELRQQASSGLKLVRPSDDPVSIGSLIRQRATHTDLELSLSNMQAAQSTLELSISHLNDAVDIFSFARNIALDGMQSQEPEILANEVSLLLDRLVALANTRDESGYLYGGTAMDQQPFVRGDNVGNVQYAGSYQRATITVSKSTLVDVLYTGVEVFQQRNREATHFVGNTGAAAAAGKVNAVATSTLLVKHTATAYAPGSGIAPGTSSVDGDSILGPTGSHVLFVDDTSGTGSAGTISLNGGAAIPFSNTDSDLRVVGPNGGVVYVDTTSITAGFVGTVDISASGTLSLDDGLTEVPIDYTNNQILTDSNTGAITNVDSRNIRRTGVEQLEYRGTADAFQTLLQLRDDLLNTRGLSSSERQAALERRYEDADRVLNGLLRIVGEQSASSDNLDAMRTRTEDLQLQVSQSISQLESADLAEVVIRLQSEETMLQYALAVSARAFDTSILDFIQ